MTKRYSSFTEIDERLRILKLQREIDRESIKLRLNRVKAGLYPSSLAGGISGIAQKLLLTFAIKKLSTISGVLRGLRKRDPELPPD